MIGEQRVLLLRSWALLTRNAPSLWALAGSAAGRIVALTSSLIAAAAMGPEGYGGLGSVLATTTTVTALAGLGLGQTLSIHLAADARSDAAEGGRVVAAILRLAMWIGFAAAIVVWLAAGTIARVGGFADIVGALRLSVLLIPFGILGVTELGALQGLQQFRTASLWLTWRAVLSGAATALGGITRRLDLTVMLLVVGEGLALLTIHVLVVREFRRRGGRVAGGDWRAAVRWTSSVGGPTAVSAIATMFGIWSARALLLRQPNGAFEAGVFDAANRFAQLALFVPASLANIQVPVLTALHADSQWSVAKRQQREWMFMGLGSTTLIVVDLMVTAPMLMGWVGAEYAGGTRVLIVIAGASIPIAMNSLLGPPLIAAGRLWTRCTADVVLAGLLVAAAWLLLPAAGGMGLPLAYVAAYGVIALWMTRSVWRLYERHAVDGMRRP